MAVEAIREMQTSYDSREETWIDQTNFIQNLRLLNDRETQINIILSET